MTDSLISGYDAVDIRQVYFRNICFDAFNFFLTDSLISGYDAVDIRQVYFSLSGDLFLSLLTCDFHLCVLLTFSLKPLNVSENVLWKFLQIE